VADETREWPSTYECAKADGAQPAEPIRDSGPCAAAKVRMYGCNRNLSAASREEKPGKAGGVHVLPLNSNEADLERAVGRSEPDSAIYVKLPPTEAGEKTSGDLSGVFPPWLRHRTRYF
jgi:hypothetical protein